MSDQPAVPQVIQILITLNGNQVQVQGPIDNKVLCYGMLEMARDAIKDYKPPSIQVAPANLIDQIKRSNGGHVQ
jgi:hypothetical protein